MPRPTLEQARSDLTAHPKTLRVSTLVLQYVCPIFICHAWTVSFSSTTNFFFGYSYQLQLRNHGLLGVLSPSQGHLTFLNANDYSGMHRSPVSNGVSKTSSSLTVSIGLNIMNSQLDENGIQKVRHFLGLPHLFPPASLQTRKNYLSLIIRSFVWGSGLCHPSIQLLGARVFLLTRLICKFFMCLALNCLAIRSWFLLSLMLLFLVYNSTVAVNRQDCSLVPLLAWAAWMNHKYIYLYIKILSQPWPWEQPLLPVLTHLISVRFPFEKWLLLISHVWIHPTNRSSLSWLRSS